MLLRSVLAAIALTVAVATSRSSPARTLSAEESSLEPLELAGAAAAPAQKRFADASSSEALDALGDSEDAARVHEPITLSIVTVLKLVGAVAGGFAELRKQKSNFLQDAAAVELSDLRHEAAKGATQLTLLFDGAVGDINTRYRDTISDLAIDMVHDPDFWRFGNFAFILDAIQKGVEAAAQGASTTVSSVHTYEELWLLRSAAQNYLRAGGPPATAAKVDKTLAAKDEKTLAAKDDKTLAAKGDMTVAAKDDTTLEAQRTVFLSLVASALRREFDAIFGWTARPAETLLLKAISPAFGDLAAKLPPVDHAAAEQLALSRLELGESLNDNAIALSHLKLLDNAYGAALDDVFKRFGDVRKEARNEKELSKTDVLEAATDKAKDILDEIKEYVENNGDASGGSLQFIAKYAEDATTDIDFFVSGISSLKSLSEAWAASTEANVAVFTTKRDVAVMRERVEVDKRLGVLNLCSMMGALQKVLAAFLDSASKATVDDAQANAIVELIVGTSLAPGKLAFEPEFKKRLARSFYARLCALLAPAHNRVAAIFRGAGQCQSGPYASFLTRDTDASHYAAALVRPHIDLKGSGNDDIYDVQLVSGSSTALEQWEKLGYEHLKYDRDPLELNANLCDPLKKACVSNHAPTEPASRRIVILRRHAILDPTGKLQKSRGDDKLRNFFNYVDALKEPVSDFTLIALPTDAKGQLVAQELYERLQEGWIQLRLVLDPANVGPSIVNRATLDSDAEKAALAAATVADLNFGRKVGDAHPPVVVPLVRRGGRMPLVAITSLPFHAMFANGNGQNGHTIELGKSDLALAETTASEYPCLNIRVPVGCQVYDLAVHKSTQPEIVGFATKVAHRLDRIFTLPKNRKSAKAHFYAHVLRTVCAATDEWPTSWERIAVSPKEGAPLAGTQETFAIANWRAELQRPYMWVQRRYALAAQDHAGDVTDVPGCPDPCAADLIKSTRVYGKRGVNPKVREAYLGLKRLFQRHQAEKAATAIAPPIDSNLAVSAYTAPLKAVGKGGWEKLPDDGGVWKAHVFTFRCAASLDHPPANAVGVIVLTSPSTDASKTQGHVPLKGHATYALYPPPSPQSSPGLPDLQPHMCRADEKCSDFNMREANCLCIPVRTLGGLSNGATRTLKLVETSKDAKEADSNQYKYKSRFSRSIDAERNAVEAPLRAFNDQYQKFLEDTKYCTLQPRPPQSTSKL